MLFPALLIVTYATIGAILWSRAMRYRVDDRSPRAFDIFRPGLFLAEGQPARRIAARFYLVGGIAAAVAYWMFRVSQPAT